MGDRGSNCCCGPPRGFDFFGYLHNTNWISENAANTTILPAAQCADAHGNWFPEWLTRADILSVGGILGPYPRATTQANSQAYTPPLTPGVTLPTELAEEVPFAMGTFFRTSYNGQDNQVAWLGYFGTFQRESGLYVPVAGSDAGYYVAVVDLDTNSVVTSEAAISDDDSLAFALLPEANHRTFDAGFAYFNQNRWNHEWQTTDSVGVNTDTMAYPTRQGTIGLGVQRAALTSWDGLPGDFNYEDWRRGDGVGPWESKTVFNEDAFRVAKGIPTIPTAFRIPEVLIGLLWGRPTNVGTSYYTGPAWGHAQDFFDLTGDDWAYVIAASDPGTGFGYRVVTEVTESALDFANNYYILLTAYGRGLIFGTVGSDGRVAGHEWISDPFVMTGTTNSDARWHGVTAHGKQCDCFDGVKAGVMRTDAVVFSPTRTVSGALVGTYMVDRSIAEDTFEVGSETWPPSPFQIWRANTISSSIDYEFNAFYCPDYGDQTELRAQLNDEAFTTAPDDAFTALVTASGEVYRHANYQSGWEPVEVRVAKDGTGDMIVVEKFVGTAITDKTLTSADADSAGMLIQSRDADDEASLTLLVGGGFNTRLVLIASLDDVVDNVRVTNTSGGTTGTYTDHSSGTQGRWRWRIIAVNTATSSNRRIWASRPSDGIVAIAACHCGPWTGTPTPTVGALPSAITTGQSGSQIALAVSPSSAATQNASFHLTGQSRLRVQGNATHGGDVAVGLVANTLDTWAADSNQSWTVGNAVTDTLGVTFEAAWPSAASWSASGVASSSHCRVRRIDALGETLWVRRIGYARWNDQIAVSDKAVYVATSQITGSLGYQRFLVIDALTGAARHKNYPTDPPAAGPPNQGWYGTDGVTDAFDRWACVPVHDEMSTASIAAWIAASPLGISSTL